MKLKLLLFKRTFLWQYCILATTVNSGGSVNSGSPFIQDILMWYFDTVICFDVVSGYFHYFGVVSRYFDVVACISQPNVII